MITTLKTGALTLASVQYKFDTNGRLTIKLTTVGSHGLYGNVDITLANVDNINIYDNNGNLITDFFNKTITFSTVDDSTELEYSQQIKSGISQSIIFATLPNNGSPITATVANSSVTVDPGVYIIKLPATDVNFSTSALSVIEQRIVDGASGIEKLYYAADDLTATPKKYGADGVVLILETETVFSIKNNVSGVTNIPFNLIKY